MSVSAIDLFCGCGGFSLGFEMAGTDVVLGIDNDPQCIKTYRRNLSGKAVSCDITKIEDPQSFLEEHIGIREIDIIFGSPPCQTFSPAGIVKLKSLGIDPKEDPRYGLWRYFIKFVLAIKPQCFVMENVLGIMSTEIPNFVVKITEKYGYRCGVITLDAVDFGVPQKRLRTFVIGCLNDETLLILPQKNEKKNTVWDAISDLPPIPHNHKIDVMEYDRDPITDYQKLMREGSETIYNHVTKRHNERDLKIFASLREGETFSNRSDGFKDRYRRLKWNEPSWTLVAHISKDARYIHPSQLRTISVREAARLQSFPDRFVFPVSMTQAFKQIGNAVPPLLAKKIAQVLLEVLK